MDKVNTQDFARSMDAVDPLKEYRSKFFIPQHNNKDAVYFNGNSLGLQSKNTVSFVNQELEDWAAMGVLGHANARNPWTPYHEKLAGTIAKIAGAYPEEVVAMSQLTVNLHLLLATFYRPTRERFKIICEAKAFPSDQYALASQVHFNGYDPATAIIEVQPRPGEYNINIDDIISTIQLHGDTIALVMFGGVNYYTGQVFDMERITREAHAVGAYAGFDLAHAIGNIKLNLHEWKVDFACWCSYKYLNSGPGGVGGLYINQQHVTNTSLRRLSGWWGTNKQSRFKMEPQFEPIPTAEGWQVSNAPVLLLAAHKAALQIFEEAGMEALLQKSKKLSDFLFFVLDEINRGQKHQVVQVITPKEQHGCQVSLLMKERGKEIFDALINQGVIADWREPNVIRIAPVPLYNSFEDIWKFGKIISQAISF